MKKLIVPVALFAAIALAPAPASAVQFTLQTCTGGSSCTGVTGSVDVTIVDSGANNVSVTISNLIGNNPISFISQLFLDYSTDVTGTASISGFSSTPAGSVAQPSVDTSGGTNAGFQFQIDFGFLTANDPGRFQPGESITFVLSSSGFNLDAANFTDGMVHINAITSGQTSGDRSIKLTTGGVTGGTNGGTTGGQNGGTVPEPASLALFGAALTAGAMRMRRARRAA